MIRVVLEKLTVPYMVKIFPEYEIRRFFAASTTARFRSYMFCFITSTCNVTLKRVNATVVAVEKKV